MVRSKILRATAVAAASAGLIVGLTGIAGASSGGSVTGPTGPDSTNKVITKSNTNVDLHSHNMVSLANSNDQGSSTGKAKVWGNTTGGSAMSGAASNDNATSVAVDLTNSTPSMPGGEGGSGATGGDITGATGPDSLNLVVSKSTMKLDVNNTNDVTIANSSDQSATSGSATDSHNTTGGDATSGAASNSNSTTLSVTISN